MAKYQYPQTEAQLPVQVEKMYRHFSGIINGRFMGTNLYTTLDYSRRNSGAIMPMGNGWIHLVNMVPKIGELDTALAALKDGARLVPDPYDPKQPVLTDSQIDALLHPERFFTPLLAEIEEIICTGHNKNPDDLEQAVRWHKSGDEPFLPEDENLFAHYYSVWHLNIQMGYLATGINQVLEDAQALRALPEGHMALMLEAGDRLFELIKPLDEMRVYYRNDTQTPLTTTEFFQMDFGDWDYEAIAHLPAEAREAIANEIGTLLDTCETVLAEASLHGEHGVPGPEAMERLLEYFQPFSGELADAVQSPMTLAKLAVVLESTLPQIEEVRDSLAGYIGNYAQLVAEQAEVGGNVISEEELQRRFDYFQHNMEQVYIPLLEWCQAMNVWLEESVAPQQQTLRDMSDALRQQRNAGAGQEAG